ncbi:long-chain-fatty-acid--CoA ligase [Dictyobacter alpinus]|uniref:Long-chain-fatty-acid--CoA ligase n=1 Tax=Dictyobacter alpinus TaxID=2014873 RepID=A0A402B0D2_9CHLR|nr:long-chain fatty acid--CoA ligase [Dictyobacter alpinus]GCE24802.1 long-chain-fatty-acid--CoA ligase [Dictyobacter alpinus]
MLPPHSRVPSSCDQLDHEAKGFVATSPWIQHYQQGVPAHIELPEHTLNWLLEDTATHYPEHIAFSYFGTKLTYTQFSRKANRFALALQHLGVKKGDRIVVALPNIPQYPLAFYGILKLGAVVVPLNPLYTEREMQHQIADSGAQVIITLPTLYSRICAIHKQTELKHIIVTSPADFLPPIARILYILTQGRTLHLAYLAYKEAHSDPALHIMSNMLRRENKDAIVAPVEIATSDIAVLQYTGGTTGLAKGAILTHRSLLANAIQIRSWFTEIRAGEERVLCVTPFFHVYGLTTCMNISILLAATMILIPRFKIKDVVKAIRHEQPTLFPGVPTMYFALLHEVSKHPNYFRSIKYCISGAGPLPAKVQERFEKFTHSKLVEGYGLSEAGPVTHCNPLTEQCRNGSIGLPLPQVDAAIVTLETGEPVSIGEVGELVVRGPNIMQGYWKRAEETEAIFRDGWLRTGDLGKIDKDGYFYLVERAKDMIIASGLKVYPREVEEVLLQHPAVAEAVVVGVPDAYRGETVAAFIVLKREITASEQVRHKLIKFCQQELAVYKVPKVLEFRTSLPKSFIGKVLRRELRAQFIHENDVPDTK